MNIQKLMQQAKQMQEKVEKAQKEIAEAEYQGASGGGAVEAVISGKGDLKSLKIDKSVINPDEADVLEDLIIAAFSKAKKDADAASNNAMSGIVPPGMKLPF